MLDGNTFGRAAHDTRTINVEANLLSERLAERDRVSEIARKRVGMIGVICAVAVISLPPLYRAQSVMSSRATESAKRSSVLASNLSEVEQKLQAAQPRVAVDEMRKRGITNSNKFLGQISLVLNAVPPNIALRSIKSEVMSGELRIYGQAEAEDYTAARAFIEAAKRGPDTQDMALSSTRRSDALGVAGVAFEFAKKVGFEK